MVSSWMDDLIYGTHGSKLALYLSEYFFYSVTVLLCVMANNHNHEYKLEPKDQLVSKISKPPK